MADREVSFTVRAKDAATAVLGQVTHAAEQVTEKIFNFKDVLKSLVGVAAGFSLAEVIKDIVDLGVASDRTFRQIAGNLPTFTEGLAELKDNIETLANLSGRSLEDMQQSAAAIARLGVGSAEELQQQLAAATGLADATGVSVDEAAQLLIQLRDEFHLTGDQATELAAKLKAGALDSRVGISQLFDAFRSATPVFEKFGIDADTGLRAILALAANGYTTSRAIRSVLDSMPDKTSIQKIADQAHVAGDAMATYTRAIQENRDATGAAFQRAKNDWSAVLESLGVKIVPLLVAGLQNLNRALDDVDKHNFGDLLKEIVAQGDPLLGLALKVKDALAPGPGGGFGGHGASGTFGGPTTPPAAGSGGGKLQLPPTKEEIAAAEAARKKLQELQQQLASLLSTTAAAKPKSEEFAESLAKWKAAAEAAKLPGLQGDLARLGAILETLKRSEAAEDFLKSMKEVNAAFDALDTALGQLQGPLAQFDAQAEKTLDSLAEQRTKIVSDADLERFDAGVANLKDQFVALRAAIADSVATGEDISKTRDMLNSSYASAQLVIQAFDHFTEKERALKAQIAETADGPVKQKLEAELRAVEQILGEIDEKWGQWNAHVEETGPSIAKLIASFDKIARSIVGAAQAMGLLNDKTASILQNTVNAGEAIGEAVASRGRDVGADVQAVTAVAALTKQLVGLGKVSNDAKQRAAELEEAVASLFANLTAELSPTGGNSLAERLEKAREEYQNAQNQVIHDEAGKKNQTEREKDLDKLNALEQERIDQIKAEYALEQQQLQEDDKVRQLRATGHEEEADALAFAEAQAREYAKAVADGADATTLAALAQAQLAEATQHAAEAALARATTQAQQDIQIDHVTDPTEIFRRQVQGYQSAGGTLGALLGGIDLQHLDPNAISDLDAKFQALFHQLETSPDTVDLAGLSIDDLKQALLALDGAAQKVAAGVESAAQQISDAENKIAVADDILGTSAQGTISELSQAYGIDLSQFDLTQQSGVDAAIAALQAMFTGLSPTDQNYDLTVHEIQTLVDKLRGLNLGGAGGVGGIGGAGGSDSYQKSAIGTVTGISDAQATGLLGMEQTALTYLAVLPDIRDYTRDLAQMVSGGQLGSLSRSSAIAPYAWMAPSGSAPAGSASAASAASAAPAPTIVQIFLDGKQIAESVFDATNDPARWQQMDRSNTRGLLRVRAGVGAPRT